MDGVKASLMTWSTEEMRFHATSKLPSEEDFEFLSTGPLVDVWKYVTEHVKNVKNAKHIKGNIKLRRNLGALSLQEGDLQPGASEEERERRQILSEQRSRFLRQLQQTRAEGAQLHRELGHAMEELAGTEQAYQSVCQRERDLRRQESLLQVVQNSAAETAATYDEYTQRVDRCIEDIINKKDNSQENFISGSPAEDEETLETESCHMVRHACEDISKFILSSLDASGDSVEMESRRADVRDRVERAAAINSTQSLVSALAANTDQASKTLRQKTLDLDIGKDAKEISFSYGVREGLLDLSTPQSATNTVKKLLVASSEEHVLRWFKEQEFKNEEWKLSSRHTETVGEIHKLLHRVIGEHPTHLAAAKGYVAARMGLAEERAVAPCLRKEQARLTRAIDRAKQERQELQQKYSQIQDFQQLVGEKQATISRLARLNASAPERLRSHKQQVESYLESRSLLMHLAETEKLPARLRGALISELDTFLQLPLPCLLTLPIDSHTRLCALDLSLSPNIHTLAHERLQTYSDVGKALEFPFHKSAECLPLHVLGLHTSLQQLQAAQRQREITVAAAQKAAGIADDIGAFIGLRQTAEEHDKSQREQLLPVLREGISLTHRHIAEVDSLKAAVITWWDQPAQWTTPWVRSGALTFDQWMQRWRMAMTQMHSKTMAMRATQQQQQQS